MTTSRFSEPSLFGEGEVEVPIPQGTKKAVPVTTLPRRDPQVILNNLKQLEAKYRAWSRDTIAWKGDPLCGMFADAFAAELKRCSELLKQTGTRTRSASNKKQNAHPQSR